jgi:hypothetical protein
VQTLGDVWHQVATEAPQFHENHIFAATIGFNLLRVFETIRDADVLTLRSVRAQRCRCEIA